MPHGGIYATLDAATLARLDADLSWLGTAFTALYLFWTGLLSFRSVKAARGFIFPNAECAASEGGIRPAVRNVGLLLMV